MAVEKKAKGPTPRTPPTNTRELEQAAQRTNDLLKQSSDARKKAEQALANLVQINAAADEAVKKFNRVAQIAGIPELSMELRQLAVISSLNVRGALMTQSILSKVRDTKANRIIVS